MCGLVGIYSSNMLQKHKDALCDLIYFDTVRGKDSTGVAAIRVNTDTHTLKSTVPGYEFLEGNKLLTHLKLTDFCWIGHNRYGTIGKNIRSNAHPFEILDDDGCCLLVGAHNGTLTNKHALDDDSKYGTDSETLYNQIAKTGIEDAIGRITGAWALSYYDHVLEELRFLRNNERPLYYAFEKGKTTLIWASEPWMISVACARQRIELEEGGIEQFTENILYSCPVPLKCNEVLVLEEKGAVAGKQAPAFFHNQRTAGASHSSQSQTTQAGDQKTQKTQQVETTVSGITQKETGDRRTLTSRLLFDEPTRNNVTPLKPFKGYEKVPLAYAELREHLSHGCGWCGDKEPLKIDSGFAWLGEELPVCRKCLTGTHEDLTLEDLKKTIN